MVEPPLAVVCITTPDGKVLTFGRVIYAEETLLTVLSKVVPDRHYHNSSTVLLVPGVDSHYHNNIAVALIAVQS